MIKFSDLIDRLQIVNFMATDRKIIKYKVQDNLPEFVKHLAMIFLIKNSSHLKHWRDELYGFISGYNGVKCSSNKKLLKASSYFEFFWNDSVFTDSEKALYSHIKDKFEEENNSENNTRFLEFKESYIDYLRPIIIEFFKRLSEMLSKDFILKSEFFEMLDNVINEYCFKDEQFTIEEFE